MGDALNSVWAWLARTALSHLPAHDAGMLVEAHALNLAGPDPRVGEYAVHFNNPQALCFLLDVYPELQSIFSRFPRAGEIRFLDIGPAFGAAPGLLHSLHRSHFLGPKLLIDVLDIVADRRSFIEFCFPHIRFHHGAIESRSACERWDLIYCSNAIEHMQKPGEFIRRVLQHTDGYAIFLAPYSEAEPMSLDHKCRIDESTFSPFNVERIKVFESAAWPTTAEGIMRQQIMAILKP